MENTPVAIRLPGLEGLDKQELIDTIPPGDLTFEEEAPERPDTSYEPFTAVAVIMLTAAGIKGLAAWLLKKRHHEEVTYTVEQVDADGSKRTTQFTFRMSESTTTADVVKAVCDGLNIDPAKFPEPFSPQ